MSVCIRQPHCPCQAYPENSLVWHFSRHSLPVNFHSGFPACLVNIFPLRLLPDVKAAQRWRKLPKEIESQQPLTRTHPDLPPVCGIAFTAAYRTLLCVKPSSSESTAYSSQSHISPCNTGLCVLRTNNAYPSLRLCSVDYRHKMLTNRSWHGSFAPSCRAQPKCHLLWDLPLTQSLSYHTAWFSS